jgi:hypothetical protein
MWRGLQAVGAPIDASWLHAELNEPGAEPSDDAWSRHWQLCVAEAAAADIVLVYAHPDDPAQMGALIEAGAALGAGKQVWVVSPHSWSWRHHPRVRNFDTLAAAVSALCALRDGEQARREAA